MRLPLVLLMGALLGCGGDGESYTVGEECDELLTVLCERAVACQIVSFNACFQQRKRECCLDTGTCDDSAGPEDRVRGELATCLPSLRTQRCDEVKAGVLPAACLMSTP